MNLLFEIESLWIGFWNGDTNGFKFGYVSEGVGTLMLQINNRRQLTSVLADLFFSQPTLMEESADGLRSLK